MTHSGVPLTEAQKALPSGMLLPSGEASFYDLSQNHDSDGSGINASFPNPTFSDGYWDESGIFKTYGPNTGLTVKQSGLFNYDGLSGVFSNGPATRESGITDFTLFNPYIHYQSRSTPNNISTTVPVKIPFISDYTISITYDVYLQG